MRTGIGLLCALSLVLAMSVVPASAQVANLNCGTLISASSTTTTGTACPVGGYNTLTFQVSGTTPGSVAFEGTQDGTNYIPLLCMSIPQLSYLATATQNGMFHCSVKNFQYARPRMAIAGTAVTVTAVASTLTFGTGAL